MRAPFDVRLSARLLALGLPLTLASAPGCKPSHDEGGGVAPATPEAGLSSPPVASVPSSSAGPPSPAPSASSHTGAEPWRQIGISMQAPPGAVEGTGCDAVLPLAWRTDGGSLGGLVLNESGGRGTLRCAFIDPNDRAHQRVFEYTCDAPEVTPAELRGRRDRFAQQAGDARDVPNAGLIAWAGTADGMGQAHVYDDKSPCELVIDFVGKPPPSDDFVRAAYERFRAALGK